MYSMTSVRTLEPAVDKCSNFFMNAMHELQGQEIDLGVWLHWYGPFIIFKFYSCNRDVLLTEDH
jgi:hypothetical protein